VHSVVGTRPNPLLTKPSLRTVVHARVHYFPTAIIRVFYAVAAVVFPTFHKAYNYYNYIY